MMMNIEGRNGDLVEDCVEDLVEDLVEDRVEGRVEDCIENNPRARRACQGSSPRQAGISL